MTFLVAGRCAYARRDDGHRSGSRVSLLWCQRGGVLRRDLDTAIPQGLVLVIQARHRLPCLEHDDVFAGYMGACSRSWHDRTTMLKNEMQHIATDLTILSRGGITSGLDLVTLSNQIRMFGNPASIGFAWQFIYVSQTLIADGFMVRCSSCNSPLFVTPPPDIQSFCDLAQRLANDRPPTLSPHV